MTPECVADHVLCRALTLPVVTMCVGVVSLFVMLVLQCFRDFKNDKL